MIDTPEKQKRINKKAPVHNYRRFFEKGLYLQHFSFVPFYTIETNYFTIQNDPQYQSPFPKQRK